MLMAVPVFFIYQIIIDNFKLKQVLPYLKYFVFGNLLISLIFFLFDTVDPKGTINLWTLIPITTIFLLIKKYRIKSLSMLIFIGFASWTQYFPLNDYGHLFWAATPMLPLYILFIYELFDKFLFKKNNIPSFASGTFFVSLKIFANLSNSSFEILSNKTYSNLTPSYT